MIDWVKLQVGIATNAKVARAGSDGGLVFIAALLQHARHGRAGRVPAHRLDPWTLKIEAVALFGAWPEERVAAAVATCCDAGLLQRDGEAMVLTGYDAESMPQCVRCRQPNDDHRYSTCATCRETRSKDHGRTLSRHGAKKSRQGAPDRTGQDNSPLPPESRASRGGASASRRGDPDPERAPRAAETDPEPAAPAVVATPPTTVATTPDPVPSRDRSADEPADGTRCDGDATDRDPVVILQEALTRTRYRSNLPTMRRRFVLARESERLAATGLGVDELRALTDLAAARSDHDPGALLAHWLDGDPPRWREVLDEVASRQKLAGARERARSAGESTGEPIAARSVIGDVLQAAVAGRPA